MNAQSFFLFEAEQIAAEAAKCEAQRFAERHEREAKQARKVLLQIAREKAKAERQAKADDWRRRTAQARTYKQTAVRWARCGIYSYSITQHEIDRGCYWRACHGCRQPLIYTNDPNAQPQECKGRR